jgi:hypothetical protein
MAGQKLEQRVTRAAEAALAEQRYVSPIDVLLRLGWLAPSHVDLWRQGSFGPSGLPLQFDCGY